MSLQRLKQRAEHSEDQGHSGAWGRHSRARCSSPGEMELLSTPTQIPGNREITFIFQVKLPEGTFSRV